MSRFDSYTTPRPADLLIAFADLTHFTQVSRRLTDADVAQFCQDFYEITEDLVESGGGQVVKFMGDAALILFPVEHAEQGLESLFALKNRVDARMEARDFPCRMLVKAHAGTAMLGRFGGREKRLDVLGQEVNLTATLPSRGVAISVQAFRALGPDGRRRFKKHTPAVTYIPVDEPHS